MFDLKQEKCVFIDDVDVNAESAIPENHGLPENPLLFKS